MTPVRARPDDVDPVVEELRRTNRLLALLLTKGMPRPEAVAVLDSAGFSYGQIGAALAMTPNAVKLTVRRIRQASTEEREDEGDEGEAPGNGSPAARKSPARGSRTRADTTDPQV